MRIASRHGLHQLLVTQTRSSDVLAHILLQGGFEKTRVSLVERPWAIDDLDAVLERWKQKPHHKAMLFVDNAGTDVVLGEHHH